MKCSCGKKFFAPALFAAALSLVLLFGCSQGGDEEAFGNPGNVQDPSQGGTQGGVQNPSAGGNTGGEQTPGQGEEQPGEGENPGSENDGGEKNPDEGQNPPQPSGKTIAALLKEIIGEADYDAISAEVAAGGLTLTAEKIKAVGDIFPSLEKDAESGKEAKNVENADAILQNKEAFVAQAQGEMAVRFGPIYPDDYDDYLKYPWNFSESEINAFAKKYVVTYKANVKFTGTFNLSEISLPDNNGKGDFSTATLTNNGECITLDKFNDIRGSSLPTLDFEKNDNNVRYKSPEVYVSASSVYDLYKAYSNDLGKLNIKGDFNGYAINGKEISGKDNYTLFTDDDKAKSSSDDSVKSLPIDALIKMYKQLKINYFVNMIISGDSKEQIEVDWILTNMVFEGDMSNIKQTTSETLTGIVYFKNKPYNNIDRSKSAPGQEVAGLLKLDDLRGVSYNTFGVALDYRFGVLDVRGVDKTTIESYNYKNYENDDSYGILANHQNAHAIYFSDEFGSIKNNQIEINRLCYKFSKHPDTSAGFFNAYLGNDRVNGESYNENVTNSIIGARYVRSLKEFEDFGNYSENNREYKFEKTAKETYEDVWESLSNFDKANLESELMRIAQNNKSCFSSVAKSIV